MRGVTRTFGEVDALAGVDLTVEPGQVLALLGHNGSGKTTLARIAAGELAPTSGQVRVCGVDPHDPAEVVPARRTTAYLPAAPSFYDDLTVREHLELVGIGHGVADLDARIETLLASFGLTHRADVLPETLSTGMRQKAQLATALIRHADLLLLDEPVANLDPEAQWLLAERLAALAANGTAIVVITHQLGFLEGLAHEGVALEDGALVARGPVADLRRTIPSLRHPSERPAPAVSHQP